jgi:hypothetical protein
LEEEYWNISDILAYGYRTKIEGTEKNIEA